MGGGTCLSLMTQADINAIAHELAFWQQFVKTPRFLNTWASTTTNPELLPEVVEVLRGHAASRVLDVGSGVVSILHGVVNNVTATDPLGKLYELIFDYKQHQLTPPVAVRGEELLSHFKPETFDVAHIRNALDHAQDPRQVIENMWALLKVGGTLIVHGFVDEATSENYQGFHQWDIRPKKNGIGVYGKDGQYFHLSGDVRTFELVTKKEWVLLMKTKSA